MMLKKAVIYLQVGLIALVASSCSPRRLTLEDTPDTRVLRTGPSRSMIYIAQTSAGPIIIDLGWTGAKEALRAALKELGTDSANVAGVFITHAHRDHIAGWPVVAKAPFYMAAPERDFLFGDFQYHAWIPRTAEELRPSELPASGTLQVREFTHDTSFVVGRDTVYAFMVTGHTPGSAAYLFRGVLFAGDALSHTTLAGFRMPKARFTENPREAAANLRNLFERVGTRDVKYVCTAHAECSAYNDEFMQDLFKDAGKNTPVR
jgi:hydroxyacylglutathione hydrolase